MPRGWGFSSIFIGPGVGVLNFPFAWGCGICSSKIAWGFCLGGWSGLELTDTLGFKNPVYDQNFYWGTGVVDGRDNSKRCLKWGGGGWE